MNSQFKLAKRLQKDFNKEKNKKRIKTVAYEQPEPLPISLEMTAWLSDALDCVDADGYITSEIAAVNAPPLDAMAVFCPSANIVHNVERAAPRGPELFDITSYSSQLSQKHNISRPFSTTSGISGELLSARYRSTGGNDEVNGSTDKKGVSVVDAIDRMEVMWLKRRAQFEAEEGDIERSFATLQEAVRIHIGNADNNYNNAKLFDQVTELDPNVLHLSIENDFTVYDSNAHIMAGRIQRWYHKHYISRVKAAYLVGRVYRGYRVRAKLWRNKHLRTQCAIIIQKRFRIHLIRMHRLASIIKDWYKLCKIRKDYYRKMYRYRMARRIQSLWRGILGRQKALFQFNIRRVCSKIQRNARGYILRKKRAFVISMYHRMYYRACRTIQCLVRRVQAIAKAQSVLLAQLANEDDRFRREKLVCDEAVRVEIRRVKMYLDTAAGQKHLAHAAVVVSIRDKKFDAVRGALMAQDIRGHEALVAFEVLDNDGSGYISKHNLYRLLRSLCVPVHLHDMDQLADNLKADSTGNIDFNVFLDWYSIGGAQVYSGSITRTIEARFLRLNKKPQLMNTKKRAEVELIRQRCSWIVDTAKTLFRHSSPSKFQCCRCLAPFVLFTDYYAHFGEDRSCRVTGERALFFKRFWMKDEWSKQRQCEIEVIRLRNEIRWVEYRALIAGFMDDCLLKDYAMKKFIRNLTTRAQAMYYEMISNPNTFTSYTKIIVSIIGICRDGVLIPEIAKKVAKFIRRELPDDWVINDIWNLGVFETWLENEITRKGLHGGLRGETRGDMAWRMLPLSCAKSHLLWLDARVLAKIHIMCLRAIQVSVEAAIVAQDEYRQTHQRRCHNQHSAVSQKMSSSNLLTCPNIVVLCHHVITKALLFFVLYCRLLVPDSDLKRADLHNLTSETYAKHRLKLIRSLALIDSSLLDIISWKSANSRSKGLAASLGKYSRIGPRAVDPSSIEELVLEDAHARALAQFNLRLRSRLGRMQVHRLACELWASKTLMIRQKTFEDYENDVVKAVHARYIFDLFRSLAIGQGIDKRDFSLLEQVLGIRIRNDSDREAVFSALDPAGNGRIDEKRFIAWVVSDAHMKYKSYWRTFINIVKNDSLEWMGRSYDVNAKQLVLINLRRLCRLEMEIAHARMPTIIPLVAGALHGTAANTELSLREDFEYELLPLFTAERTNYERGELSLLHRLAADDAERRCRRAFWTRSGRYRLQTEKLIVADAREVSFAYGCCLTNENPAYAVPRREMFSREISFMDVNDQTQWGVFVKPLLLAFDTDCSGAFDENEVHMLMKFVQCGLSEKTLLLAFPEVKSGTVTLERITSALGRILHTTIIKRKVFGLVTGLMATGSEVTVPCGLHISTKSDLAGSSAMLISLCRQLAWELSQQASVVTHSEAVYSTIDEFKSEQSLLFRCQVLAMRQVSLYLRTFFGKLHRVVINRQIQQKWKDMANDKLSLSAEDLVRYAYSLHEDWKGILITELPHLIRYLVIHWKAKPAPSMSTIGRLVTNVKGKNDLFWLSESDVLELVLPALILKNVVQKSCTRKEITLTRNTKYDTLVSLQAQARQQALLIALRFKEIRVSETNYRCYVLGLQDVIAERARRAKWGIFKQNVDNHCTDWKSVPREALSQFLFSEGYTLDQMCALEEALSDLTSVNSFTTGQFSLERLDVKHVKEVVRERIYTKLKIFDKMYCIFRYIQHAHFGHLSYKRTVKALTLYENEVEARASEYLKEIISGVSHCISKDDMRQSSRI